MGFRVLERLGGTGLSPTSEVLRSSTRGPPPTPLPYVKGTVSTRRRRPDSRFTSSGPVGTTYFSVVRVAELHPSRVPPGSPTLAPTHLGGRRGEIMGAEGV